MLKKNDVIKALMLTHDKEELIIFFKQLIEMDFVRPEHVIVGQGEKVIDNDYMFFIERGECEVRVKDKSKLRNTDKTVRTIYPGDYFGEIGVIYRERRSCSVVSSNYTTVGRISS